MSQQILYTSTDITIEQSETLTNEILLFLESIVWGTKETLFKNKSTSEHLKHLINPSFVVLRIEGIIKGVVIFLKKEIEIDDLKFRSYYFRYLSAAPDIKGKGIMSKHSRDFINVFAENNSDPHIFYACVENKNDASIKLASKFGFTHWTKLRTFGFSRFFPKHDKRMVIIENPSSNNVLLEQLKTAYSGHIFFDPKNLFVSNQYYTLQENNEIIAGVQAYSGHWSIQSLSGIKGFLSVNILPHIPYLKRIVNPKDFRFLALDTILMKEGREDALTNLIESVLAHTNHYVALIWVQENTELHLKLQNLKKFGLAKSLVGSSTSDYYISFNNCGPSLTQTILDTPVFVSAFNLI